jgi:hypothetical protein
MLILNLPFYFLVMTNALIQSFLHSAGYCPRGVALSLSLLYMNFIPTGLLWYDLCLSDIQQVQSEFLQLTAGDTHQRSVEARETDAYAYAHKRCDALRVSTKCLDKRYHYA